jgi:RNAse (barnase) inhibitor barstar
MTIVIDTRQIIDSASFHKVFAAAFGFFEGYGNNMDAWIDCMSGLDDEAEVSLSTVTCEIGDTVVLHLEHAADFAAREAHLFQQLLDCSAFVNWRRIEKGDRAILALSYHK